MSELDVLSDRILSLTDSKICGFCETLLYGLEDSASSPAAIRREGHIQVHASVCLKDVGIKAITCHLCALFFSLFDHNEQREFEDGELEISSEWSSGTLRTLFVGKKSLPVHLDSKYKTRTPFYIVWELILG
jgi:hypothetical protein